MTCEKCGGKFHYLDEEGSYRRCEDCFVQAMIPPDNLPAAYAHLRIQDIGVERGLIFNKEALRVIKQLIKRIETRTLPLKVPVFESDSGGATPLVAALMNFSSTNDLSAKRVILSQLTEDYFKNRKQFFEYFNFDILFIQVRAGVDTSANVAVLDEIIQERQVQSKATVITKESIDIHPQVDRYFSRQLFKRVPLK